MLDDVEDNRQADTLRWMPFRNDASETVPAYGLMRVTGSTRASRGREILTCAKPDTTLRRIYVVNGAIPVLQGRYGSCAYAFDGPVFALYEGGTPAVGEGWGAKPSSWKLNKNYPCGFTIQGRNNTDKSVTLGIQQPINSFMGKLNGALNQGSTAAVSLWKGSQGSESDETSWDITAGDWLMKSGATAIASGKKVVCTWINGLWYITEAECA